MAKKLDIEKNSEKHIDLFKTLEDGEIEKLDTNEWEIDQIVDVIKDEKEIEILEAKGGMKLDTNLDAKDVKRGDTLWITAILKPKSKSTAYTPGTMGVLKVRVVDMFYGLSKLKQVFK